jgi:hypothetical protein
VRLCRLVSGRGCGFSKVVGGLNKAVVRLFLGVIMSGLRQGYLMLCLGLCEALLGWHEVVAEAKLLRVSL